MHMEGVTTNASFRFKSTHQASIASGNGSGHGNALGFQLGQPIQFELKVVGRFDVVFPVEIESKDVTILARSHTVMIVEATTDQLATQGR